MTEHIKECGDGYVAGCFARVWHQPDYDYQFAVINELFNQGRISAAIRDEALTVNRPGQNVYWGDVRFCLCPFWEPLYILYEGLTAPRWAYRRRTYWSAWLEVATFMEKILRGLVSPYWRSRPVPRKLLKDFRERKKASYDTQCRHRSGEYFDALDDLLSYVTLPKDMVEDLQRAGVGVISRNNWSPTQSIWVPELEKFLGSVLPGPRQSTYQAWDTALLDRKPR